MKMDLFTETYGFESDDLDAVTKELARVLKMTPETHFYEGYGGDYTSFGDRYKPGGDISLYPNHHAEVDGPTTHEEDFPEMGLILLIQQRKQYVSYEPKFQQMELFNPILLHRSRYETETKKNEILFDLAKERSKPKP